jgi:plasmid stabilization system protein ParE
MRAVILEPEAFADITEAHDWYEERRPGLGAEFEAHLDTTLDWIARNVGLCKIVRPAIRRHLVRVFPYAVYFRTAGSEVRVTAVLHGARGPETIRSRLKS